MSHDSGSRLLRHGPLDSQPDAPTKTRGRWSGGALFCFGAMILTPYLGDVHRRFGPLHAQLFESADHDLRYCQIAKPFVVCRDHKPWSVWGASLLQRFLERFHVIVPVTALLVIGLADLPLSRGVFQSLLEARQLLGLRDMQEKLEDGRMVLHHC